ncbi:MAG: hypothetical protein PWR21_591 [Methanoculleus sp.]|nr:hypothetical protein [Methanoculleus sp.]
MKFPLPTACLCCALIVILFSSGCMTYTESRNNENMTYFMEKVNESQEYYDNLVAVEPNNAEAWCIRGMYYNNCYGQYAEAMESCNRALELDPEYGIAWFLKGVILTNMNVTDEAALCFENATRYDPGLAKDVQFVVGNA